jgi:predicted membrane protein
MVEVRVTRMSGRLVLGLIVMALGTLWTLDNLGIIDSEPILRWWPALIVVVGLVKLLGLGTTRNVAAGTVLLVVGSWLLAGGLGVGWVDLSLLWPLILVVIGVNLVIRSRRTQSLGGAANEAGDRIGTFAVWSGIDRKVTSQAFRGGDVTAVMGGAKIDFTAARIAPEGAVIDLFVWWGGLELRVPEDWKVVLEGNVLMGGIEDKSKAPPPGTTQALILRGIVIMGGIEIKN